MLQMFPNGFKNFAALVSDIDHTFKEVGEVKTFLEDPDAYAAANPVAAVPTGGGGEAAGGAKAEEKKVMAEEDGRKKRPRSLLEEMGRLVLFLAVIVRR